MKPQYSLSIKNWSEDDQPREKLRDKGPRNLSDAELLAILIGSGSVLESAVDLSKRILSSAKNDLNALGKFSLAQLMEFKGIGEAKAIKIIAAIELAKRRSATSPQSLVQIRDSKTVFMLMQPLLGELPHEEFWVLYLNNSNKVLSKYQLSKGGITATLVDIRLLIKHALERNSTGIILVHNHPSDQLDPSQSDKRLTQKLKTALESLDIKLIDHIIVTEKSYFSFADESLL